MVINRLIRRLSNRLIVKLGVRLQALRLQIGQASLPKFANNPKNLTIELPRRLGNTDRIFLGNDILIGPNSLIIAITEYPSQFMLNPDNHRTTQTFEPIIKIGNRVTSTGGLQIAAHRKIIIEDDVLLASNINITDGLHGYKTACEAYKDQNIFKISPIIIKKGSWIGQNVVVLPGVTIGEYAIVGANSIVTENIPDRCIAVGSPIRVIKKWDVTKGSWLPLDRADSKE